MIKEGVDRYDTTYANGADIYLYFSIYTIYPHNSKVYLETSFFSLLSSPLLSSIHPSLTPSPSIPASSSLPPHSYTTLNHQP